MSPVIHGEKREFRLHKDILWSIVKSQAGTIGKAARGYLSARRRAGLRLRQGELLALDLVTVETDDSAAPVCMDAGSDESMTVAAHDAATSQNLAARIARKETP